MIGWITAGGGWAASLDLAHVTLNAITCFDGLD